MDIKSVLDKDLSVQNLNGVQNPHHLATIPDQSRFQIGINEKRFYYVLKGTSESRVKYVGKYRYVFRVFFLVFS